MDLQLLCSNEPGRESISRPWSAGDWTFATDGRILVRVPRINTEDKYKPLKLEAFKFGHDAVPEEAWVDGVVVDEVDMVDCKRCNGKGGWYNCTECDGEGKVESTCDACGHSHSSSCGNCGGEGIVNTDEGGKFHECHKCHGQKRVADPQSFVEMVGMKFATHLLFNLYNAVGAYKVAVSDDVEGAGLVKFEGGTGYVMSLRR